MANELVLRLNKKTVLLKLHLYGLDLWGLDYRWLRSLDHTVDLNRLSVGQLYQCYCGTCC